MPINKQATIRRLWSKHYPKRGANLASVDICRTISLIIRERTESISVDGSLDQLDLMLHHYGVPRTEFEQFMLEFEPQV